MTTRAKARSRIRSCCYRPPAHHSTNFAILKNAATSSVNWFGSSTKSSVAPPLWSKPHEHVALGYFSCRKVVVDAGPRKPCLHCVAAFDRDCSRIRRQPGGDGACRRGGKFFIRAEAARFLRDGHCHSDRRLGSGRAAGADTRGLCLRAG